VRARQGSRGPGRISERGSLFTKEDLGKKRARVRHVTMRQMSVITRRSSLNIGVADAVSPVLEVFGLPSFAVSRTDTSSPPAGQVFNVTDLGRARIKGHEPMWVR